MAYIELSQLKFTGNEQKIIGHWHIIDSNLKIGVVKKPSVWTRFWAAFLFGVDYIHYE